jgi:polar amino acid transport system substrate-binding protein
MRRRTGLALLLLALAATASCAPAARQPAAGALGRIQARGELVVGTAASMPPMNMTTRRGEVIGLDVDLARAMAAALGVKLRLATIPFPDLLAALQAGTIDAVMSSMTITPERSRRATFVGPYFVSGKSFVGRAADLAAVSGPSALNAQGMRLAALRGSTSQAFIEEAAPRATFLPVQSYDEGIDLVLRGQADALVADFPVCVFSVFRYPGRGLYALVNPFTREPIGIALPQGDAALEAWTRTWLQGLEASGALQRMQDRWFKDASWLGELPG